MTYNKQADYCTDSPDVLFGVKISKACYHHDRQYRNEVKRRKTREEADVKLMKDIIKEFDKENKKSTGVLIGFIYYCVVRMFNWRYWVND